MELIEASIQHNESTNVLPHLIESKGIQSTLIESHNVSPSFISHRLQQNHFGSTKIESPKNATSFKNINVSKSTLAEYAGRVDYKNMKILSVHEFRKRQDRSNDNKSEEKLKMSDYLHQDNLERLGASNLINQS